jgi:hypothetical protein
MINKKIGLITLLAGLAAGEIMAGTIASYNIGDVLIGFRNGQTRNLVVDAGPINTFTNAAHNQRITISQYTTTQFDTAFGDANDVYWSAFTWLNGNALFMSSPRADLNAQTTPWSVGSPGSQQSVAALMGQIQLGALYKTNFNVHNSSTAVIEPQGASSYLPLQGSSYYSAINNTLGETDVGGNFNGNFSGTPEFFTGDDFAGSGTVLRSDFYMLPPGASSSKYLGYFEMADDGTMSYVAYPTSIPVILSVSRSGNISTITYTTGTYGTYTLLGTSSLTAPISAWPAVSVLSTGDASVHIVTDTDSSSNKFYIISAQ